MTYHLTHLSLTHRSVRAVIITLALLISSAVAFAAEPSSGEGVSHWAGTTKAGCSALIDRSRCSALQKVKFTFVWEDSTFTGSYTCAYGNRTCRGAQTTGKVTEGSLKGDQVRFIVTTPDKSICRYNGRLTKSSGKGAYSCIGGSELREEGTWRIHASE